MAEKSEFGDVWGTYDSPSVKGKIEYRILKAVSEKDLESLVNAAIQNGWKIVGGVSVIDERGMVSPSGNNLLTFYQAITKEE